MSASTDNMIADLAEQNFIVFAGAGIPNGDGKATSWRELLEAFKEAEPSLGLPDVKEVPESKYPDYAQKVFDALRAAQRQGRYFEILSEKLSATNARCSIQQRDIIETAQHVVTTNFDDSFTNAMERELEGRTDKRTVQSLPDFQQKALNHDYSVSYLHGNTDERCIVFKKDDYELFYPSQSENSRGSDNLEVFLRHLYEERMMVFIGVSFNDEYLSNALKSFYSRVKQNDEVGREQKVNYKSKLDIIQHYAFMPEDMGIKSGERCFQRGDDMEEMIKEERIRKLKFLGDLKIKVVTYKKHVEWTNWFKAIREECRRARKGVEYEKDPSK